MKYYIFNTQEEILSMYSNINFQMFLCRRTRRLCFQQQISCSFTQFRRRAASFSSVRWTRAIVSVRYQTTVQCSVSHRSTRNCWVLCAVSLRSSQLRSALSAGIYCFAEAHLCKELSRKAKSYALDNFSSVAQYEVS